MSTPYAAAGDVETTLGNLAGRLPADLSPIETWLSLAHAEVVDVLSQVYPNGIPPFAAGSDGREAVRWAEAKIAAAEILEAVRINLTDLGDVPTRLRDSALRTLADGVVGYPPGSTTTPDPDDPDGPGIVTSPRPRVSSYTPASAFPDPYESLRGYGIPNL